MIIQLSENKPETGHCLKLVNSNIQQIFENTNEPNTSKIPVENTINNSKTDSQINVRSEHNNDSDQISDNSKNRINTQIATQKSSQNKEQKTAQHLADNLTKSQKTILIVVLVVIGVFTLIGLIICLKKGGDEKQPYTELVEEPAMGNNNQIYRSNNARNLERA